MLMQFIVEKYLTITLHTCKNKGDGNQNIYQSGAEQGVKSIEDWRQGDV